MRRLTVQQWTDAINALRHAEADYECWESDGDTSAADLWRGIIVLRQLIDHRRPSADWETVSETSHPKGDTA